MRTFALTGTVAALAVGAYLFAESAGPGEAGGESRVESAEARASAGVASANLQAAAVGLETARAASGTYANAQLPIAGVRLVRADATSYCLETQVGPLRLHLRGPRQGAAAPGPCS